jgi:hypothetical protein
MKLFVSLLIGLFSLTVQAQNLKPDSSFVNDAVASSVKIYDDFIHGQELFYNGSAYVEPARTGEPHPFFMSEDWTFGDLSFDGEIFRNVPLLYDIMIDQLITESATGNMQVLPREKVRWFTLSEKKFEYIDTKTVNNSLPRSGFYELLYGGKTKVICLRQKLQQEKIEARVLDIYYEEKNRYFVLRGDEFVSVKNKGSLIKVLKDQKSELKSFVRKNATQFNADRDALMAAIARQYDVLTTNKQ